MGEHVEELGEEKFKETYFGGQKRIDTMKVALKNMREATDGRVAILSASWGTHVKRPWLKAPIDENYWAEYLVHLTGYVGLGFDREHVIGVYAPGPPVIPEKGEALEAYYKKMYGTTPVNVVHIDKFKYASRILAVGGNLLQPDPYYVQQFSLNELLVRMGGKQVTALDHIANAIFGSWRRSEDAEDAESAVGAGSHTGYCTDADKTRGCREVNLRSGFSAWCICGQSAAFYTQEAPSGTDFVVYGFAALGVGALASVAWKAFQNRKLAEHVPLQTNDGEPEL